MHAGCMDGPQRLHGIRSWKLQSIGATKASTPTESGTSMFFHESPTKFQGINSTTIDFHGPFRASIAASINRLSSKLPWKRIDCHGGDLTSLHVS